MSDAPIRIGHPDINPQGSNCDCCEGTALATLQPIENRPNLSAIAFRVGDHGRFKSSMLTNLASADFAALADLGTREDDDFSIALIDAWAATCDVLTFYQERFANEAYMQTATERLSIGELARLIGYRLHPGAAAETDLVILMDDPPGAEPDVADLTVPAGVRVQSQPGPEEEPQIFETLEDLAARVAWNRLLPRLDRRLVPGSGATGTWLEGSVALQPGDAIVIVGRQRGDPDAFDFDTGSERWAFRRVTSVTLDADLDRSYVTWDGPLEASEAPLAAHRFYHLHDRASLFGYNAPHPRSLSDKQRASFEFVPEGPLDEKVIADGVTYPSPSRILGAEGNVGDWSFILVNGQASLDAVYKRFVKDSWAVMTLPGGPIELYRIDEAVDDGLSKYAISGKSSRLTFDSTEGFSDFRDSYRRVSVYGGSEELAFADTPQVDWVAGSAIELESQVPDLPEERKLIFQGRRARLEVRAQTLSIEAADGDLRNIAKGGRVTLLSEPVPDPLQPGILFYELEDIDGFTGFTEATETELVSVVAEDDVEQIVEVTALDEVLVSDATHSELRLATALDNAFDRRSLVIYANVARAAHGEGVTDILGAGDPSQPFQKFLLKQSPVTHHVAPTETGIDSTLTVRVDGVEWNEVPDLYDRGATARVFRTTLTDAGETLVEFGDGRSGARPTAGRDNIVADYSKGLGLAGNLRAGQLTLPLDRPLGLRETLNPLPATGGDDAEVPEDARRNAPTYTLTLGRVVSITDYRDFALGFPGIAKAESRWVWQGETRRIVVTVAGPGGTEIADDSTTFTNLLGAFRDLGDPLVGVDLLSFESVFFRLGIRVATDPAYIAEDVLANTETALRDAFGFQARDFAQTLALSEIAAAAHEVPGVVAIDVDRLYRDSAPQKKPKAHNLLVSQPARQDDDGTLLPAEILTLSPNPFDKLEVMA